MSSFGSENIPGDILAYDAGTGEHLCEFHVIPRPGSATRPGRTTRGPGRETSPPGPPCRGSGLAPYIGTNPPTIDLWRVRLTASSESSILALECRRVSLCGTSQIGTTSGTTILPFRLC